MVAAPLVALGLTHPEGHDLLGKAEQSVMLLLGVFLRPALLILGFLLSIVLANVAFRLSDYGLMAVIQGYLLSFAGMSGDVGGVQLATFVGLVGVMVLYTYLLMAVIDQSFSLTHLLSEKVLRWVGGPQINCQLLKQFQGCDKG